MLPIQPNPPGDGKPTYDELLDIIEQLLPSAEMRIRDRDAIQKPRWETVLDEEVETARNALRSAGRILDRD